MDTKELARLGMQIAFGWVHRKTSPAAVKYQTLLCSDVFGLYYNADGDAVYDAKVLIVKDGELVLFWVVHCWIIDLGADTSSDELEKRARFHIL